MSWLHFVFEEQKKCNIENGIVDLKNIMLIKSSSDCSVQIPSISGLLGACYQIPRRRNRSENIENKRKYIKLFENISKNI